MRGDGDPPALVDAHALEAAVHARDESAQADLADEGAASVVTADRQGEVDEGGVITGRQGGRDGRKKVKRRKREKDSCTLEAQVRVP